MPGAGRRSRAGRSLVDGRDVRRLDDRALRKLRGNVVSYVPQDPGAALNPAIRIGKQIIEILDAHGFGDNDAARRDRVAEVMREVLLPGTPDFLRRYPHQLSGGQQQRVGLAMAFACRPALIVLDEPTTGLDVTTQAHVLDTVRALCQQHRVAALYVTHDLAVVANLADRVAVMYAGRVVEEGPDRGDLRQAGPPVHALSHRGRARHDRRAGDGRPRRTGSRSRARARSGAPSPPAASSPTTRAAWRLPPLAEVAPLRTARCVVPFAVPDRIEQATVVTETAEPRRVADAALSLRDVCASYSGVQVVHDITFDIERGECVALVGESGSGKSTLSKSIGGLHHEWTGELRVGGRALANAARARSTKERLAIQYVFQNPYQSLNPRRTIGDSVARPLAIGGADRSECATAVGEMLERVSLTAAYAHRYPDQLSGGERQRAAIARALVSKPELLICDEVTSALDVLVQAAIIDLLGDLQRDLGLSMLFVTHNLPVVRSIAARVAVMADGKIVELGDVETILTEPAEEYTKRLLANTPVVPTA